VGRLGALELAAADRAIADRQQDVALAEQALVGRALDLEHLLGRPVGGDFQPYAAADSPSTAPAVIDQKAEMAHALESSPALKALKAGVASAEVDILTAESLVRPRLDFVGSVAALGRQGALGEAWEQTARLGTLAWSAGLQFALPVQNRVARGNADAVRGAADSARIDVADLELQIRDGAIRLSAAARTAARRYARARAEVGYAEKNLQAEKARFDVGRSTNNDVLLRQQELKTAELQVARAVADQAIAEAALDALTGDILDRYGVVLTL
jgi:outer membrane protein TolC